MPKAKTVSVKLTPTQIDYLRGIIYEYYNTHNIPYQDIQESEIHSQLESILAAAENKAYA
jgi:hypothetical protein